MHSKHTRSKCDTPQSYALYINLLVDSIVNNRLVLAFAVDRVQLCRFSLVCAAVVNLKHCEDMNSLYSVFCTVALGPHNCCESLFSSAKKGIWQYKGNGADVAI